MFGSKRDSEIQHEKDATSAAPEKSALPPSNVTPLLVEPNCRRPLQQRQAAETDALAAAAVESRPVPRLPPSKPVAIAEAALASKATGYAARNVAPLRPIDTPAPVAPRITPLPTAT